MKSEKSPMQQGVIAPLLGALLVVVLLAGCAGVQTMVPVDPAERLKVRVAQYWDARVRGDILETYRLHEPAFRRAVSLTAFLQGRGVVTTIEYQIVGEEIRDDLAIVRMKVHSSFMHPKMIRPTEPSWSEFEEQWVRAAGDWYRRFRFPVGDPYPPVNWDQVVPGRQIPSPPGRP